MSVKRADSVPLARWERLVLAVVSLVLAASAWLPLVHCCFSPELEADGSPKVAALRRGLRQELSPVFRDRAPSERLAWARRANPEWDFMARTFQVLAYANLALLEPDQAADNIALIDAIIADTIAKEKEHGHHYFLLPYSRRGSFVAQPDRSIFVDGEIALMLAARRLVEDRADYKKAHQKRVTQLFTQMRLSPVLSGESYPDECWTFCNTVALGAIRIADVLDGTDHQSFLRHWVEVARAKLIHPESGLLVSSYTHDGRWLDGPEGSSIWMSAHSLLLIDEPFAREQYERARAELGQAHLGFGSAREWPRSWRGKADIDSGLILGGLDISAGSSGLAVLAARAFDDRALFLSLYTTLRFAAFPVEHAGTVRFAASNYVGDAVLLYALSFGPLWQRVPPLGAAR